MIVNSKFEILNSKTTTRPRSKLRDPRYEMRDPPPARSKEQGARSKEQGAWCSPHPTFGWSGWPARSAVPYPLHFPHFPHFLHRVGGREYNSPAMKGIFASIPRDLRNALLATLFFGAASGIFMATLNNYLSEVHGLGAAARGWLEFPRELPGFLIMFIAGALLTYLSESQMASLAMVLTAAGAIGLGFLSPTTAAVVLFVTIWSLGDHIIFAVEGPIGLKLARQRQGGQTAGSVRRRPKPGDDHRGRPGFCTCQGTG